MKKILYFLVLSSSLAFNSGCSAHGSVSLSDGTDDDVYAVHSLQGEGVDDSGNMWFAISGSFDTSGNDVQVDCDGQTLDVAVESENSHLIEIATPANSQYNSCSFSVYILGQHIGTISQTNVNAMEVVSSSVQPDSSSSYVDVTLQGNFFVEPLTHSDLSVTASCDGGGTTFSPHIIDESATSITVLVPNPGSNQEESCDFEVQDSFIDSQNNQITVSSPDYPMNVTGY